MVAQPKKRRVTQVCLVEMCKLQVRQEDPVYKQNNSVDNMPTQIMPDRHSVLPSEAGFWYRIEKGTANPVVRSLSYIQRKQTDNFVPYLLPHLWRY